MKAVIKCVVIFAVVFAAQASLAAGKARTWEAFQKQHLNDPPTTRHFRSATYKVDIITKAERVIEKHLGSLLGSNKESLLNSAIEDKEIARGLVELIKFKKDSASKSEVKRALRLLMIEAEVRDRNIKSVILTMPKINGRTVWHHDAYALEIKAEKAAKTYVVSDAGGVVTAHRCGDQYFFPYGVDPKRLAQFVLTIEEGIKTVPSLKALNMKLELSTQEERN